MHVFLIVLYVMDSVVVDSLVGVDEVVVLGDKREVDLGGDGVEGRW